MNARSSAFKREWNKAWALPKALRTPPKTVSLSVADAKARLLEELRMVGKLRE